MNFIRGFLSSPKNIQLGIFKDTDRKILQISYVPDRKIGVKELLRKNQQISFYEENSNSQIIFLCIFF